MQSISHNGVTMLPDDYWSPAVCALLGALLAAACVFAPLILVLLSAGVMLILAARENEFLILGLAFFTPLGWFFGKTDALIRSAPSRSNIDVTLLIRCMIILGYFGGRLMRGTFNWRRLVSPVFSRFSLIFVLTLFISAICSTKELMAISMVRVCVRSAAYCGSYFMILSWCDSQTRITKVVRMLVLSTMMVALFAILQRLVNSYTVVWHLLYPPGSDTFPWDSRSTSVFDYPNDLASYLNLALPFVLALRIKGPSEWKSLTTWTFGLGVIALLCTQSRGGLIAYGCMLIAMACFVLPTWRQRLSAIGALALIALAFVGYADSRSMHVGGEDLTSGATRLFLWNAAILLFTHHPIHGVGWGNFQVLSSDYVTTAQLAGDSQLGVHNTYLALLSETGILGFGAFVALIWIGLRQVVRRLRVEPTPIGQSLALGIAGAIIALLVQGLVEFPIAVTQVGVLFWTLLALWAAFDICTRAAVWAARRPQES